MMKTTMLFAAAAATVQGGYDLSDTLGGPGRDFFSEFTYYTGADQTHGYVNFQGAGTSLTHQDSNGVSWIRADTTQNSGGPRKAIKLYSKKKWNKGLFILDVNHIPGGTCGSWPAWWFNGEGARTWPATGEIDVLEYVHKDNYNQGTLHTAPGCYLRSQEGVEMEGRILHSDCGAGGGYTGCGSKSHDGRTAGDGFNNAGGGVYIVEFNFEQQWPIKMWSFVRDEIPEDIKNGQPNPLTWKLPFAMFHIGADCPNSTFDTQTMIFDQTFCGDWAGASGVWNGVGCAAQTGYGSCNDYVRENGSAFQNAYFEINNIKIYQFSGSPAPPPAPVPTPCTAEGEDPYASGSFVSCCGSARKCLKQSAGWAYRCQSCSQSCPDEQAEFNDRCGVALQNVYYKGRPFTPLVGTGRGQQTMSKDKLFQDQLLNKKKRPAILKSKGGYSVVTSGSCQSNGMRAVSQDECPKAAYALLGLPPYTPVKSVEDAPAGCVYVNMQGSEERAFYNSSEDDTVECGNFGYYDCICTSNGAEGSM